MGVPTPTQGSCESLGNAMQTLPVLVGLLLNISDVAKDVITHVDLTVGWCQARRCCVLEVLKDLNKHVFRVGTMTRNKQKMNRYTDLCRTAFLW